MAEEQLPSLEELRRISEARQQRAIDLYSGLGLGGSRPTKTAKELYAELEDLGLTPKARTPVQREQVEEPSLGTDPDIYASLVGAAPTRRENQEALASVLRHRGRVGETAAILGDESLRSFGKDLMNQTDTMARQLQDTRQKDIDNAQTKYYQDAQLAHMGDTFDENQRQNTINYLQQAIQASRESTSSAGLGSAVKMPPLPEKIRDSLVNDAKQLDAINGLDQTIVNFGQEAGNWKGVPFTQALQRKLQSKGVKLDEAQSQVKASWDNFKQQYEAVVRNKFYGATLTDNELAAMREYTPNENWDIRQIRLALSGIRKSLIAAQRRNSGSLAVKYDPDEISFALGTTNLDGTPNVPWEAPDVVDDEGRSMTGRKPSEKAPAKTYKSEKEELDALEEELKGG